MGNPVFNDASGARVSAIQWGSRIFLALVVLLAAALALTLRSHVSVPGLERLVPGLDAGSRRGAHGIVEPAGRARQGGDRIEHVRPEPEHPADNRPRRRSDSRTPRGSADARRAVAPTTAEPIQRAEGPAHERGSHRVGRTISASPTVRAGGQGTVKPRNPKAATPSPPHQRTRPDADPKQPTTDIG